MPPNPYRRQPNINDMMYPKGSKQPRQVWAAVMNVYKAPETTPQPTPSPTGTANPTPTPSVTPTQTLTPTNTGTPTQTPTNTGTPTQTPTQTQTQTPSNTPNPLCPQQLDIVGGPLYPGITGTYNRLSVAPTQTFTSGYIQQQGNPDTFVFGTAPDGKNYAAFGYQAGGASYMFARNFNGASGLGWVQYVTSGGYLYEGGTIAQVGGSNTNTGFLFDGSVYYPATGQFTIGAGANYYYLSYPLSCPTPTPSVTQTQTQTPTNTQTPTQTQSGTPQVTSTPTQTPTPSGVAPGTTQAQAYLSAVVAAGGSVSAPMSAATITMFNSIWSNGFNTNMVGMYPFIGGTAASHAVQAMSPGVYNLTFNGGWTHNTSGATPNGTNAYAVLSGLVPQAITGFTLSGGSLGTYCGTDAVGGAAIGSTDPSQGAFNLYPALLNPTKQMATTFWNNTIGAYSITTIPDTLGLMSIARSGSTSTIQFYRKGSLISSQNHTALQLNNISIFFGANNQNGIPNQYSTYRHQFSYIYRGTLTTSQMTTLDSIIQTYQTSLGRNVY